VGVDYDLDANNRLSAQIRRFDLTIDSETTQAFELEDAAGSIARAFDRQADRELDRKQTAISGSWRRKFSGQEHELVTDFLFDRTDADTDTDGAILTRLPAPDTATRTS
jgi:hypothetical protein